MNLSTLIKDEREGQKGRKAWLEANFRQKAPTLETALDCASMLEGAILTIDRLLDELDGLRIEPQRTEEG